MNKMVVQRVLSRVIVRLQKKVSSNPAFLEPVDDLAARVNVHGVPERSLHACLHGKIATDLQRRKSS